MSKKWWYIFIGVGIVAILLFGVWWRRSHRVTTSTPTTEQNTPETNITSLPPLSSASQEPASLSAPIADFQNRITKKKFGTYVTPKNSPVQPERFAGFHTGVDVEYGDVSDDVPVIAIADGTVTASRYISGYGGVVIFRFSYTGKTYSALYGHLRPATLPKVGQRLARGERLALLGTAYSHETDGERRHLHFALWNGTTEQIRGYVANRLQLSGWIDPLTLYR